MTVSVEYLRECMKLDPETGQLWWKHRPDHHFETPAVAKCVNSRLAGKEAFTAANGNGYRQGQIAERKFLAHRVAWALHHGEWPPKGVVIDHINGDGEDNRPANLRLATPSQNGMNKGSRAGSTSKYMGVCRIKSTGKWQAGLNVNGKRKGVGNFDTEEEAAAAYNRAALEHHGQFARLNALPQPEGSRP